MTHTAPCRPWQAGRKVLYLLLMLVCAGQAVFVCGQALANCPTEETVDFSSVVPGSDQARRFQGLVVRLYGDPGATLDVNLADGIIGPVTMRQLLRFCRDIELTSADAQGISSSAWLVQAMDEFVQIVTANSDWRQVVTAEGFVDWLGTAEAQSAEKFVTRVTQASNNFRRVFLLPAFKDRAPAPAAKDTSRRRQEGLFVLTETDIEQLGALGLLDSLVGIQSSSRAGLRDALSAALAKSEKDSAQLVNAIADAVAPVARFQLTTAAAANLIEAGVPAAALGDVTALTAMSFPTQDALESFALDVLASLVGTESAAKATEAAPVLPYDQGLVKSVLRSNSEKIDRYAVTSETVMNLSAASASGPLSQSVLERLATLQEVPFPDDELLRTAIRTTVGPQSNAATKEIVGLALKSDRRVSQSALGLAPIGWQGGECGCGVFESLDHSYPSHLYGLYPYWQGPRLDADQPDAAAEDPAVVDFSLLERIGYYGVTFDERGQIRLPLHFQQKPQPANGWFWQRDNYAEFVKRAHQYKTKVDLVVYNNDWQPWLSGDKTSSAFNRDLTEPLIDSIRGQITQRLDGYANALKPIISLGFTSARTLGDGVTLDFDFELVPAEDQVWLYDQILGKDGLVEQLRQTLVPEKGWPANVQYFINMMIPGECIAESAADADCAFYDIEKLSKLKSVDLFLVDTTSSDDGADTIRRMRTAVGKLDVTEQIRFQRKLVPLMSEDALTRSDAQRLRWVDWNFAGLASWGLNNDPETAQRVRQAFVSTGRHLALPDAELAFMGRMQARLASLEATVCNATCPRRWLLRSLIFSVALLSLIYIIASYWFLVLRGVYDSRLFVGVVVFFVVLFVLTLWCDPFWSQQKSTILFVSLLLAMLSWAIARQRRLRARYYP
ncbi:MAG: hypothetical protein AB8G16_12690 [Gammaproteobacteria bacterium]